MASLGKAGRESVVERLESVYVERLEFVGVESESCWSCSSRS